VAGDIAFGKASASIGKKVLPFAFERFVVRMIVQRRIVLSHKFLGEVSLKTAAPFA
jgi:hypothetical protein